MWQFKSAVIFGFLFVIGFRAEASPVVTKHMVKGFEIYLVDMKAGNRIGMTYVVPYGSANDEPKFFGRAHFFEHMSGRGSLHFPGHDTMDRELKNIGFENNAATGPDMTMYYAIGNEKQALRAMDIHFDPLHGLELEQGAFEREKKTVINEIVDTAPNRPERAGYFAPYLTMVPDGHSLKGHHDGSLETLVDMSLEDLRQLHRKVYRPGQVKIAILGNFSSGQWKEQQILEHLQRILPAGDASAQESPQVPPGQNPELLFATGPRVLELDGTPQTMGLFQFALPEGSDSTQVAHFLTAIATPYRGGLSDYLKVHKGWITGLYGWGSPTRMGSHSVAQLSVRLTDLGYAHRDEVAAHVMKAIELYRHELLPEPVVARFRQRKLNGFALLENDLGSLLDAYPDWLVASDAQDQLNLNWRAYVDKMTPHSIREGARALDFDQMIVVFQGPKVESPEGALSVYNLKFKRRHLRERVDGAVNLPLSLAKITVPNTELQAHQPQGQVLDVNSWRAQNGVSEVHLASGGWPTRLISVVIDFPLLAPLEELSFETWVEAFSEDHHPELTDFRAEGIQINVFANDGRLGIQVEDEFNRHLPALQWVVETLQRYQVKPETLVRIKESAQKSFAHRESGQFPGIVVGEVATELLSLRGQTMLELERALPALDLASVSAFRERHASLGNKILVFSGAFYESEVEAARALALKLAPQSVDPRLLGDRVRVQNERLTYVEPWLNTSSVGVGIARLMRIPGGWPLQNRMALSVAKQLMHDRVFSSNRQFGYVQGVTFSRASPLDHHLRFYGQANDQGDLEKVVAGWDKALSGWTDGDYSDEEIIEAKAGVIATLEQEPETSEEAADAAISNLDYFGNPFAKKLMIQALSPLTPADVRVAVAKYMHGNVGQLTVIKGSGVLSCGELLTDASVVRDRLTARPTP